MNSWNEFATASTPRIVTWAEQQLWARAMAECAQDARWHAEGDVWTHVQMVLGQLEGLTEWPSLDRPSQLVMLFVALFHDSGKPATTVVDPSTGRTHSPKHSLVSAELARAVLRDLGCDLLTRERIVNLVRYHGRPPYLMEKPDPAREVISLSWLAELRLLYLFALADTRGRRTTEFARSEETLEWWKIVAEENACFDRPFAFANDQARFLFYRDSEFSLHYIPSEKHRCVVTLMSGLPGAGKDSWIAQYLAGIPVVSLDELRFELSVEPTDDQGSVIQAARECCREYLRAGRDFVFNGTNTMRQTRRRWINLFAEYGARINVVYVEPPLATVFAQNARRSNPVPRQVIERLLKRLEVPNWTESHGLRLVGGRSG